MWGKGSNDEALQESSVLACKVGQAVTVLSTESLAQLPDGDYEEIDYTHVISIKGTKIKHSDGYPIRVRRLS